MRRNKNSTITMRVICTIVFLLFTFCYLYFYQNDILAVEQHVLSCGKTHYNRILGAILITVILYFLQLGVFALTGLRKRTHAMTYLPSFVLLLFITAVSPRIDEGFSFGAWLWLFPLILILYILGVMFARGFQTIEPEMNSTGIFSQLTWTNLLEMVIMMICVGLFSTNNEIFHHRMRAESCLIQGDWNGAVKATAGLDTADSSLTFLRAIALSHEGKLGEKLFEVPVTGGSTAMLPNGKSVKCMMYPLDSVYLWLGKRYTEYMSPLHYLHFSYKHHTAKKAAADYLLTSYLMDKNLDAFVATVGKFYNLDSVMPKHYREALILYTHHRAKPKIIYHSSVMDADFQDYQTLEKIPNPMQRQTAIRDTYGNTYWYYWQYGGR
ncbi:MAG: DUF6057 family protein [Prevotella sp.]|nr:DUF6057 family protein [Prevotella sp.]